jgi:peptidoglycan/xylan/chitin deacetylase (PgdA/CDA1 family)
VRWSTHIRSESRYSDSAALKSLIITFSVCIKDNVNNRGVLRVDGDLDSFRQQGQIPRLHESVEVRNRPVWGEQQTNRTAIVLFKNHPIPPFFSYFFLLNLTHATDGPSADYTPRLLDLLKARHLKATFFLIGQNVQAHPELVRRIIAEGHEVGNHTWDHPQLSKLSDERATDEIEKTQAAIRAACGVTPVLLRPPYGALNKPEHVWIPERLKLNVIYWSVDTIDWKHPGASTITQRVLAGARPGAIILQHDIHGQTIDAMAAALDGLIAKGYHLVTISQLIAMESPEGAPTPSPHVTTEAQSVGPQRDSGL